MSEISFDPTRFSKMQVLAIIDIMAVLDKECSKRGIKFSQFSKDDLYELFMAYRAYKLSPPATF